ncbi:MAG TPA: substrate-binding domain-containing protein, partial [Chthoniobacteraceae bacterium]|nr:substrate-binding domain-containing protein [Chthoniobacteraceae bacterium]
MNRLVTLLLPVLFLAACGKAPEAGGGGGAKKLTIALLPKSKGNQYFVNVEKGAREAANELGAELLFDGPTNTDPAKQNEIVENWITLGVD